MPLRGRHCSTKNPAPVHPLEADPRLGRIDGVRSLVQDQTCNACLTPVCRFLTTLVDHHFIGIPHCFQPWPNHHTFPARPFQAATTIYNMDISSDEAPVFNSRDSDNGIPSSSADSEISFTNTPNLTTTKIKEPLRNHLGELFAENVTAKILRTALDGLANNVSAPLQHALLR